VDLWRSVAYDEETGRLGLAAPRVRGGGKNRVVPAPLAELPLFARAGAILPLLPADVDTLAGYGDDAPGVTSLRDRKDRLHLLAFPRLRSSSRFYGDGKLTSIEGDRRWTLRIDSAKPHRFAIEASLATLRDPFAPRRVAVVGEKLATADWDYDRETGALELSVRARRAEVVVSGN
jgi:hypothetical protein